MLEIDLHGLRLYDALDQARKFIEDSYYNNAKSIKIIHGRGDGKLMMAVRHLLDELKTVNKLRLTWAESDLIYERGAVTLIKFND